MLHEAINKTEQAAKNIFKVHVPLNLCLVQANTEIQNPETTRENTGICYFSNLGLEILQILLFCLD